MSPGTSDYTAAPHNDHRENHLECTFVPNECFPLILDPIVLKKIWGGRRLERLGKTLGSPDGRFGESWELADMPVTSASGAGGGAFHSRVRNGPLAGRDLSAVRGELGENLLGSPASVPVPLLIKFLDAGEHLSVQVHPSPAVARRDASAHLKTECWYIVDADPGAVLYKGVREGVTREAFSRAARAGSSEIVEMLNAVPAKVGDCHNLPSGTVHALGAGVLVAEVQTPSDTTYRLYDWGRAGRELHVEAALKCASFPGEPEHAELQHGMTVRRLAPGELCTRLVTTDFFTVDELSPMDGDQVTLGYACGHQQHAEESISARAASPAGAFAIVMLSGQAVLEPRSAHAAAFQPEAITTGDTALVPRAIAHETCLRARCGTRLLRVGLV
jgi:mannose-6-phosphate isomerase